MDQLRGLQHQRRPAMLGELYAERVQTEIRRAHSGEDNALKSSGVAKLRNPFRRIGRAQLAPGRTECRRLAEQVGKVTSFDHIQAQRQLNFPLSLEPRGPIL